jgi:hypothetical protein
LEDDDFSGTVATNVVELEDEIDSYTIYSQPSHGTLELNDNGSFTYVPFPNYYGLDQALIMMCDPCGACDISVLEFEVTFINDMPIVEDESIFVYQNTSFEGNVSTNDYELDIEELTYFPQYNGCIVKDIYDFIDMDPWNEELFDLFEKEIGGDELDLMYKDLEELSYKGKQDLLSKDEDLKREYESGEIGEAEISEGFAYDLIWECQSENDEWKEKISQSLIGKTRTKEWKDKQSEILKGNKNRRKKVMQYDKQKNFIKEWDSVLEAAIFLNKKTGAAITEVCSGKRKSIYGYIWEYKK